MKIDNDLRRKLIALAACASDSGYKPILGTIHFEPKRAVATDQYILGVTDLEDGPADKRCVPARELAAALRRVAKADECTLDFGETEATLTVGTSSLFGVSTRTQTLPYPGPDEKYPDVDRLGLEKRGTQGEAPHFNPSNLARIAALADDTVPIRLHWWQMDKPIVVTADDTLLGLVMPVRT